MNSSKLEMNVQVPLEAFALNVAYTGEHRVVGVFGASGAGKTTLLECIAGLRRNAQGYLKFGEDLWLDSEKGVWLPAEHRAIGYVPQDHLLFPHLNVQQNLEAGAPRSGAGFKGIFEEVIRVLELGSLLQRSVAELSGGERQRVALGRALCSGPQLLMLDEPLAALDYPLRQRILPLLLKVRDVFKVPMLIVSHNPVELQALCDEVIVLQTGEMVARGSPTEVFTRKEVYLTAAEAGYENILEGTVLEHYEHTTTVQVCEEPASQPVFVARCDAEIGVRVLMGIRASEILVSRQKVKSISARNQLPASILQVESVEQKRILTARLSDSLNALIVVEVTPDALEELALEVGGSVYLIIKSSSIVVYV